MLHSLHLLRSLSLDLKLVGKEINQIHAYAYCHYCPSHPKEKKKPCSAIPRSQLKPLLLFHTKSSGVPW